MSKFNEHKPTLYLIRGCPGAGKSTFAKDFYLAMIISCSAEEIRWFEADTYFFKDGTYNFDASKLWNAHNECQENTRFALSEFQNVIVSNTSTTEKEVETYRKIAEDCNANFVSLIVENRHGSDNIHNVPEEKVQQMKQRFSVKL